MYQVNYFEHNGVKLAYTVTGQGTQSMVLIHGWCDNHRIFNAVADYYSPRYRIVNVDLRGHGASDKPQGDYSIARLVDDVAAIWEHLDIQQAVIVGHSLGGAIALELAARKADLAAAVIALDGVILLPEHIRAGNEELIEALRSPAWLDVMRGIVDSGFIDSDDLELRHEAHAELERLPQHLHIGVAEAMLAWDAAAAARACNAPVLYIDSGSGLSDLEQFKALCPQLVIGKTMHLGHNQMVATPTQVLAQMNQFLEN